MQTRRNKIQSILKATLFILLMVGSVTLLPIANAHTPALNIPTISYINVAPNPIGIGQTATVNFWLMEPPPTAGTIYGDRWANMTVTVTKPDGTTQTLGPFVTDDTGGTYTPYTPSQLGNYTFQMSFAGQKLLGVNPPPAGYSAAIQAFVGDYYQPSISTKVTLSVQEEPVGSLPTNPFPTNYWTRPINAQNNNWYKIAGNWLGLGGSLTGTGGYGWYNASSNYNPYTTAPNTAHILWTKPEGFGGTIGGEFGGSEITGNYWSSRQYERMFQPIIMQGILYYEIYPGSTQNPQGWTAVDLHTGETLYTITTPVSSTGTQMILRCGQILDYLSPNAFGARPYLWTQGTPAGVNTQSGTTTYNLHEPSTGNYILSVVNGSAMTITEDDGGNLIGFYVNSSTANEFKSPTLNCWNSTQCIIAGTSGADAWEWYPYQNSKISFSLGLMWSMPLATNISGAALPGTLGIVSVNSGVVVMTSMGSAGGGSYTSGFQIEAGYSMTTGQQLWIVNRTQTPFTKLNGSGQNSFLLNGDGVYIVTNQNTYTETGYDVKTGTQLWQTVLTNPNTYDNYLTNGFVANGVLYLFGLGGDIYALNVHSGEILWHQTTNAVLGPSGTDNPYGTWPIWTQGEAVTIADGKLYFPVGHEYSPPLFRGAREVCLNITNGEPIWNVLGFYVDSPAPIADGVMTTVNGYDNQIYAFGKGPTSLTVSAPQVGVTTSTPLTITGTITDISAGSQQNAVAGNYPNGLPCVSDKSMSAWMEFIYEQQQCPTNATGVPIAISVVDANGNLRSIGTATSNVYGTYSLTWKPDISGDYTVIANFAGSESYYPSSAAAAFYAGEPSTTSPPQPTQPASAADQYILPGIIAIIVVIIVCFGITILLLRKRP